MNISTTPNPVATLPHASLLPSQSLKILLLGNNPIELGSIYDTLHLQEALNYRFEVDVCFREKDGIQMYHTSSYDCVIFDDSLGHKAIRKVLKRLNPKTNQSSVPTVLLKSNSFRPFVGDGIVEFMLKTELTLKSLSRSVLRSISFAK